MDNQTTIKRQLIQYLKRVKTIITLDGAYIVGSRANGKATSDSDVDLLLLSSSFNHMDADERLRLLYRLTVGIDFDLHIHAVTPEEFAHASSLTSLGAMRKEAKVSIPLNN